MNEQIKKIVENNVEVRKSHKQKDINDVEFDVWEEPQSYGQKRIDIELGKATEELTEANAFDGKLHKTELIDKAQAKITRLGLIQTEMDR